MFILSGHSPAQSPRDLEVDRGVFTFLKTWLLEGEVDAALRTLDANPVFPRCAVDAGASLKWRRTRAGVLRTIRPAFAKLADESKSVGKLDNLIASQEKKLDNPVKSEHSNLFDLYAVDRALEERILRDVCSDRVHDNSAFFANGIKRYKSLYLVLFHFKNGLLVTMIWSMDRGRATLVSLEFPTE